jgi:gamma-glutamyltranspeptidase / glutathione hydrolase
VPTYWSAVTPIGSVQGVVMDLRSGRQYSGADLRREGTVIGLKPGTAKGRGDDDDDRRED